MRTGLVLCAVLFAAAVAVSSVEGVTLSATATHYKFPSGGNTCNVGGGAKDTKCVSISDGFTALWSKALKISRKFDDKTCHGDCQTVCCKKPGPGLGDKYPELCRANGGHLCVKCTDTRDACKHHNWIKVSIADGCPSRHPCNTCKGNKNPCKDGRSHIDLCNGAFHSIAKRQPDWLGLRVEVSTDLHLC